MPKKAKIKYRPIVEADYVNTQTPQSSFNFQNNGGSRSKSDQAGNRSRPAMDEKSSENTSDIQSSSLDNCLSNTKNSPWGSDRHRAKVQKRSGDEKQSPMNSSVCTPKITDNSAVTLFRTYKSKYSPRVPYVQYEEYNKASRDWMFRFPCDSGRLYNFLEKGVSKRKLEEHINSIYAIIHKSCIQLFLDFIQHKQLYGTQTEKSLYADMDFFKLVDRLLKRRPLSFLGAKDKHLLSPGKRRAYGGFESIGSDYEEYPYLLKDFLSYDEMRLSALMSLSSWSCFVNDGNRKNFGEPGEEGTFQKDGVIVGQVGARLKKPGVMEFIDCVVTPETNTIDNGFGRTNHGNNINAIFGKFWGLPLPTYDEAKRDFQYNTSSTHQFIEIDHKNLFNVTVFKKRISLTADILLSEAISRAKMSRKKAYVHVVGLGLGVWRASELQDGYFVEAWGDSLSNLSDSSLIAHVDFSWFSVSSIHGYRNNDTFKNTGIVIHFSKRNLHGLVPHDCILVCNYAWDGNSYPGNEFWLNMLCSTGDSAAACSSSVAELHNPAINSVICSDGVRVATSDGQLLEWRNCFD